jgi:hypothetical protein
VDASRRPEERKVAIRPPDKRLRFRYHCRKKGDCAMELSSEERQRIYLEEKTRLEAQTKLKQEQQNKAVGSGCGGCALVVVVLFFFLVFVVNLSSSNSKKTYARSPVDMKVEAYTMAETFVKRHLKAPATAQFPWITDSEVTIQQLPGNQWRVSAYVDSENSFGAKIRSQYDCTMKWAGGDRWQLQDINIE